VHGCRQLVAAYERSGLAELAPGAIVEYFPGSTPQQVAKKADPCQGAKPERHSHFFDADGAFGSLDADGNPVDDGSYEVHGGRVKISDGVFAFTITDDDTLVLHPVITPKDKRKALEHPYQFSTATWQVSVSYEGLVWKRVDCEGWC